RYDGAPGTDPSAGVGQFDSSGNGSIRQRVARAVPPHLDPLPQGEETARMAQWKAERSGLFATERFVHRFPKEEGREKRRRHGATSMSSTCRAADGRSRIRRGPGRWETCVSEENTKLVGNDKREFGGVLITSRSESRDSCRSLDRSRGRV